MTRAAFQRGWLIHLLVLVVFISVCRAQNNEPQATAAKIQTEAEELFNKNTPEARAAALPKYVEALKLWRQLGDETQQIIALNKLVDIHTYNGEYAKALEYSDQILPLARKLGEKNLEGGVLYNIGRYYDALGETRKGLAYAEKSAELLRGIGEKQREAVALNAIGAMNFSLGEIEKALDIYNRVLALRRETLDRRGEAFTLINLGKLFDDGGDKRKSLEFYEPALTIAVEIKDTRIESLVVNNIGSVLHDLGEYEKAYDAYQKSLALYKQNGDQFGEAVELNNLASIYRDLGDFENALKFINQATAIYRAGGLRREEASALSSTGAILISRGENAKALELYQKSLEIYRSLEHKSGESGVLRNIGKIHLDRGEFQKAAEYFRQSLNLVEEIREVGSIAGLLNVLGQTYDKLNDAPRAEASFARAVSLQRESGIQSEMAESLYHYARFEASRGRAAPAMEKMREVIGIIENLRNSITAPNLRSSYFAEQQKYFDFYVSLLVAAHRLEPKKGFDALALKTSESARARSFLEFLGEAQTDIRAGVAPALLAREKILRQTINAKETQRLEAAKEKSAAKVAELEKELAEMLRKYGELQREIRRASPQFAALVDPEPLDLPGIQTQVLDENSVLLEYFLGAERSFLFFVSSNDLEIIELPKRETIETLARQTVENLKARGREISGETPAGRAERLKKADAETEKNSIRLSEVLIAPLAGKIQNKRLLVVASDVLQYVPFAALKTSNSASETENRKQKAESRFLIETNEIVNLPSASVVPVLRQHKTRQKEIKNLVAILADPVFSNDDARLKSVNKTDTDRSAATVMREAKLLLPEMRSGFGRLRFSRAEAEAISSFAPNSQRFMAMDFAANLKTATGENLQKSRIVHLATHGVINSDYPELSGVVFSLVDETGKTQDGFLRLHDIYNLRFDAELVVLSACETALGKEIKGEGVVGLARGFMYAGASAVAASLWRVEDRATAELMKRFYQKMLGEELPPAAALRAAQISMLKEKSFAQPFFWAGFTLQGDWRR